MNPPIVAAVLIAGGSTALRIGYDAKITDKPGAILKVLVGVFAAGAVLALLSGSAPGLASVIAWTLAIASLMVNGKAVATATGKILGR